MPAPLVPRERRWFPRVCAFVDVVLLHNEKAGDENWTKKQLVKLVRSAGFEPEYFNVNEALDKPRALVKGKFVVVAGGDGSIRKAALALHGLDVAIAPLPLGTANNIARSLGMPVDPEEIVAGWKKPWRRRFDIGMAAGPWGKQRFVEGVGLGLISRTIAVLTDLDEISATKLKKAKHRLHRDAFVAAALAHELPPIPVKLVLDHRDASDEFLLLEILNIRRAGPAFELAPHAKPDDGRFDVVAISAERRWQLMDALRDRLADEAKPRDLASRRASTIRFTPAFDCEVRIDDRTVPLPARSAVRVTIERGALELVLPKKG